jgi:hypothetical protein
MCNYVLVLWQAKLTCELPDSLRIREEKVFVKVTVLCPPVKSEQNSAQFWTLCQYTAKQTNMYLLYT